MNDRKPILLWGLLLVSCIPSLLRHLERTWRLEQYHYLPALALAFGLLVALRWDRKLELPRSVLSLVLLILGLGLSGVAVLTTSSWLGAVGLVCYLGSWLAQHKELEGQGLIYLWPMVWMLIPLPLNLDVALTQWLQYQSTALSSYLLDATSIPHAVFGNVLELEEGRLFVEEACSGVQSLFTVLFIALALVAYLKRSIALIPAYVFMAVVWAGLMNVIRIFAIAYARQKFDLDLAHGWQHAALGYVCLGIAFVLLLSTDRLLRVFFFPIAPKEETGTETNPAAFYWNKIFTQEFLDKAQRSRKREQRSSSAASSWISKLSSHGNTFIALCGLAAITLALQAYRFGIPQSVVSGQFASASSPFVKLPVSPFKTAVFDGITHEARRGTIEQPFGEFADVWQGKLDGTTLSIAVSQPYHDWHDLTECYLALGMTTNSRTVVENEKADDPKWNHVAARFVAPNGMVNYVWFSGFDRQGNPVDAPAESILGRWIARFAADPTKQLANEPVAMVQLLVETDSFLLADVEAALGKLHIASREDLRQAAMAAAGKPTEQTSGNGDDSK